MKPKRARCCIPDCPLCKLERENAELREDQHRLAVLVAALLEDHFEYGDLDALDREILLIDVGILERGKVTEEDAQENWAADIGLGVGDDCTKFSDHAKRLLRIYDKARRDAGEAG